MNRLNFVIIQRVYRNDRRFTMRKIRAINDLLHILKINKKILSDKYGVTDIAVFGSYVRNEQNGKSDIDIFVELKPKFRTFDNFMDLKFYLQKITSKKIDLVIKNSIRKELKPIIFKEAVHAWEGLDTLSQGYPDTFKKNPCLYRRPVHAGIVKDDKTYDAVMRNIQIIGEAIKHLPAGVRRE